MSEVKVSIIMPVYNSGAYLPVAVESILQQSMRDIELILVDDGSTDGSSQKCDDYAARDSRVKVIHQKNGGICAARNAALKIAQGKYVGFSDHDDEYSPGQIEDNYKIIERSCADIVKFGCREIISNREKVVRTSDRVFTDGYLTADEVRDSFWQLWRNKVFNCVWDSLIRRSFLTDNGIEFNTFFKTGSEDFDLLWHCVGCGCSISLNSNVYYKHYIRIGFSTSAKFNPYNITTILERTPILFGYVEKQIPTLREQKADFAYYWLQSTLGSLCYALANPACKLTKAEKLEMISSLKGRPYFCPWLKEVSLRSIAQLGPKQYALLLWLYRNGFYGLCLNLYSLQYRMRGVK